MINLPNKLDAAKWLVENRVSSGADQVWINAYISLGYDGFKETLNYVETHDEFSDDKTKYLIRKVFEKFFRKAKNNPSGIQNMMGEIVNLYCSFNTKVLFLEMLNPRSFRDKDLAIRILEEFEGVGIPEHFLDRVNEIREGSVNRNNGYESYQLAFEKINENSNINNNRTLNYYFMQLKATKFSILEELYDHFNDYENIKTIISLYISRSMDKPKICNFLKNKVINKGYIDMISNFIDSEKINNKHSREFLLREGKNEILKKFTAR